MPDILATIPLSAIRLFEAAARLKSFTRAAEELGVTQAAVSWQVKALEKRLDQPLFQRLPREIALTPAGERLSRAATEAVTVLRSALNDLVEADDGVLSITTLQTVANQWLAPRLGGFQLANPKLAVRLETEGRTVDLAREGFDVGIRSGGGEWPGLESHFLFSAELTPLCAPSVLERLGALTDPADLLDAPRIGLPEEWAAWFQAAGVAEPTTVAPLPRLTGDAQMVEIASALAGQGVALGSPLLFAAEIASGRLVRPFEATFPMTAGHWLVYPRDRRRSPKIAAFRDWILACAAHA